MVLLVFREILKVAMPNHVNKESTRKLSVIAQGFSALRGKQSTLLFRFWTVGFVHQQPQMLFYEEARCCLIAIDPTAYNSGGVKRTISLKGL